VGHLPALEINAQDEKLSTNLNNANALLLNDPAEMPY
jgi:hypothetical protein